MGLPRPQSLPPAWNDLSPAERETKWDALTQGEQQTWVDLCRDVGWLMDQPQFRRFTMHVLDDPLFCGTYRSTFDTNGSRAAYLAGRRDVGLELQQHLQVIAPKRFMQMLHGQMNARQGKPPPKEESPE